MKNLLWLLWFVLLTNPVNAQYVGPATVCLDMVRNAKAKTANLGAVSNAATQKYYGVSEHDLDAELQRRRAADSSQADDIGYLKHQCPLMIPMYNEEQDALDETLAAWQDVEKVCGTGDVELRPSLLKCHNWLCILCW